MISKKSLVDKSNSFYKKRLLSTNIRKYFEEKFPQYNEYGVIEQKQVSNIKPLIQNDYGEALDCTITSITTLLNYLLKEVHTPESIYTEVEKVSKKYFYNGKKYGTIPIFIDNILKELVNKSYSYSLKAKYGKKDVKKYLKCPGVGYTYDMIKNSIKKDMPVIINISSDNRGFYNNHTILVIGYYEACMSDDKGNYEEVRALKVYDNWVKAVSYVDFDLISKISSINYFK